jgi:phosphoribosylaminoimidazole-succinocarboxamide synthase
MPPHVDQPKQAEETIAREKYLKNGIWEEGVYTDPYIKVEKSWELYSAKKPITDSPLMKIEKILSDQELNSVINKIILPSFMAIENNWNNVDTVDGPVHLVDIKFELGIKSIDNSIVLSDVVDNDSWRIWPGGNPAKQLDKQSFREGEDLISVANKYELVTKLTSQFKGVN